MKRAFANIGFSFAVTLIVLNFLNVKWALAVFAAVSVLFVAFLAFPNTRKAAVLPVSMLSAALACVIFIVTYNNVFLPQTALADKTVNAQIYIVDIEQKTENGFSYTVKTKSIDMQNSPQNIKLTVYSDSRIYAESYELLNVNMSLFSAGENAFDSRGSFDDDIFLKGYINSYQNTDESAGGIQKINKYFIELRSYLSNTFSDKISGDEGALSLAVLTGDTSSLSGESYNNFKACGATHLMAVSGFNLAVITGLLYKILRKILVPKVPLIIICCASVLFYVMLAGFSASMIRAAIMMIVFLLSKLLNERTDSLNSLGFSAFVVCLNPFAVTDAGALLTFTAVLGLIVINPHISSKFKSKNKLVRSVTDTVCASVSVFITTFPVMYFMFGEVSFIGLLLNVVLIPLSELLMISSVLLSMCLFSYHLEVLLSFVCRLAAKAMLYITDLFAGFSFSTVNISSRFFALLIFCAFTVFAVGFFIKGTSGKSVFRQCTAISCVFAVIISVMSAVYADNNTFVRIMHGEYSNAVIVYNTDYALVLGVREYEQYYTAKEIITANDLYTAMVIDYGGDYSAKLADECGCLNYVTEDESAGYAAGENIVFANDFRDTLWSNTEILYNNRDGFKTVCLKIYETNFEFNQADLANTEKYDIIYTVNSDGYTFRGVNKWAE